MLGDRLLIHFPKIGSPDEGFLSVAEMGQSCPFMILRSYWVYGCPDKMKRGGHAHHQLEQILICVSGEIEVMLSDGDSRCSYLLNHPSIGLYQPRLVWGDLVYHSNSVLLALASAPYLATDYIRCYQEFLKIVKGG